MVATPAQRKSKVIEEVAESTSSTQELTPRILSASELRDVQDFDSAIALLQQTMGVSLVEAREELGDGFEYTDNKDLFLGVPCLFFKWELTKSSSFTDDNGDPIPGVQAWILCQRGGTTRKYRIADFSTGISKQLWEYTERTNRTVGLHAPLGLRKSEFTYRDPENGKTSQAATFYIDVADPDR